MGRVLGTVRALTIEANVSPCAHTCRYCSIGDRSGSFPWRRWLEFTERFIDWAKDHGPADLNVGGGFFPSYNFDIKTYTIIKEWYQGKLGVDLNWFPLGGLKMYGEEEMRRWLIERQAVGMIGVVASFVGHGAVHDRWNGRKGDFDFLMRTLQTAAELGLEHSSQLFLTKSSLPMMEELVRKLDALPTAYQSRHVRPFYYIGHGAHHDSECITEDDRKNLPAFISESISKEWVLRSEREWIEIVHEQVETPTDLYLHLELNLKNIDRLEAMSCNEIYTDLETRARASLAMFPNSQELSRNYANSKSTRIYMSMVDLSRVWLHRFVDANQIEFDASLLHYHLGRSRNPPLLWNN